MMKGVKPLVAGVGCLLLDGLTWTMLEAIRDKMIITVGIIATNDIRMALIGALLATGSASIALGAYQLVPAISKSSLEGRQRRNILAYRTRSSGPKEVGDQLMIQKELRPRLSGELDRCLEQLDDLSDLLSRFDLLIKRNEAEAVSNARIGLEEIERTICANFKWVLNSLIAADADDTPDTKVFYEQCFERIEQAITANSRSLEKGNQFLLELADNISELASDTTMLDAWMETIRAQNEQSLIEKRGQR